MEDNYITITNNFNKTQLECMNKESDILSLIGWKLNKKKLFKWLCKNNTKSKKQISAHCTEEYLFELHDVYSFIL